MVVNSRTLHVLMVTSEWPTAARPEWVPFIVQQVDYLRQAGIDVDVFPFRGAKNPVNYLKAWLAAQKKMRSQNYDVVHAQFGQSGLIGLPKRLPLVVTFHGSDLQGDVSPDGHYTFHGRLLQVISKFVAWCADEVIVVSAALGQTLGQRSSYHLIPSGLDLNLFQPMDRAKARQELGLPQNKKLVLFGGRPEMPVKRYALARQAVSLIQYPEVELIALSSVAHQKMPLYINACDVIVLTSLHEGSPTIVKEALACNIPIVSTDVGDVRERIDSIDGCIVCEDDRPGTIAAGLTKVLKRAERIEGRKTVLELDEHRLAQKLLSVYQAACDGH